MGFNSAFKGLTGKSEGKRPLRKLIVRWAMTIKWILRNILSFTMAALSKAWVCGHSLDGIAGSNPAGEWMYVSCECCVLSGRSICVGLTTRPEQS